MTTKIIKTSTRKERELKEIIIEDRLFVLAWIKNVLLELLVANLLISDSIFRPWLLRQVTTCLDPHQESLPQLPQVLGRDPQVPLLLVLMANLWSLMARG